jgi:prepilin-type N-terminal cleavage/methylation domain-containing protein
MSRRRYVVGFTLIELIVVISLMGVATGLGVTMFVRVTSVWQTTSARTELNRRADDIFGGMRRDFATMVSAKLAGETVRGSSRTAQDERFFKILLEDDRVVIPVETVVTPDGAPVRAAVTYHVERKEGGHSLMRTTRLAGGEKAPSTSVKVADGVLALRVEYADPEETDKTDPAGVWQNEWTKPVSPRAVRVSVTLADPDRPDRVDLQIARKAVFPIKVD